MLRTAEEILETHWNKQNYMQAYFVDQKIALINVINEARKEAIEECAEKAKVKGHWYNGEFIFNPPPTINKQSILSLINELK